MATPISQPGAGSLRQPAVKIVPKGLRSFDAHDADFFLELLPGPRDREGLPDSLRFWKTRIEETDPDNTFARGIDLRAIWLRQVVPGESRVAARMSGEVMPFTSRRLPTKPRPGCSRACDGNFPICRTISV